MNQATTILTCSAGAAEVAALIQHDLQLLLDRLRSEQAVEGTAAGDTVVLAVRAPVGAGHQMLDRGLTTRQGLPAEETLAALTEEKPV
jgi:hypothetical protein